MRIVLAEDEALLREGLGLLLERAGYDVVACVVTATELLDAVRRSDPMDPLDIVITDVRMPPGRTNDGLRAAIELRRDRPGLPILLLSQYLGNEYLQRLLDSAEDDPRAGGSGTCSRTGWPTCTSSSGRWRLWPAAGWSSTARSSPRSCAGARTAWSA